MLARIILERATRFVFLALLGGAAVFFAMHAVPGDPALTALGESANAQTIAEFRSKWNLDEPLPVQFALWIGNVVRGDFGQSISIASGTNISTLLLARLPNTIFIGLYSVAIAVVISLVIGTIAAVRRGKPADTAATAIAAVGISMPDFWIGYLLILAFSIGLGWFPAFGFTPPGVSILGALHSGFLPAFAIAAPMAALFARNLRSSLVDIANRDHVLVARSFGFGETFIFVHNIFRNALIPYITVIGLQVRYLLGGTVVIERIFGVPGIGALMVDGAFGRDYPVVQACALVFLFIVLCVNELVDIVCNRLNPRTR